ncbi:hypothetical protein MSIBF_A1380010 [groundwater metagenome]|uniref:Uncharacterized protein n=1 Tax=groundwater metagenome TaxID=717931 RepID=A0A098E743_9ZZZZ
MVSSQNLRVKCKNLVFCTRKVEIYNLIYPVLLRGYKFMLIPYDYKYINYSESIFKITKIL